MFKEFVIALVIAAALFLIFALAGGIETGSIPIP